MTLPLRVLRLVAVPALFIGLSAKPSFGQAAPVWNGFVRCTIDIKGPGYVNHLTHTWTLSGAVPADGGVLDYPATWSVSGEGSRLPPPANGSSATWKTQGSAPGVRMAIFVRPSDRQLVVFLRSTQLNAPNGTIGIQVPSPSGLTRSLSPASSTTLYIQVRHVAGLPANDLYSMRIAMSGSQTVPLTVIPLAPQVISATLPPTSTPQTGTIAPGRQTQSLPSREPASDPATAPPPQDNYPSTCATAGNKVVNVGPGQSAAITGGIDAAVALDWFTVRFNSGTSLHVTLRSAVATGSEFQVRAYGDCATPLAASTTGTGTKTLDFPDSGPHTIILRVSASPWDPARATYNVRLEAR